MKTEPLVNAVVSEEDIEIACRVDKELNRLNRMSELVTAPSQVLVPRKRAHLEQKECASMPSGDQITMRQRKHVPKLEERMS
jgi:hypothetical protein